MPVTLLKKSNNATYTRYIYLIHIYTILYIMYTAKRNKSTRYAILVFMLLKKCTPLTDHWCSKGTRGLLHVDGRKENGLNVKNTHVSRQIDTWSVSSTIAINSVAYVTLRGGAHIVCVLFMTRLVGRICTVLVQVPNSTSEWQLGIHMIYRWWRVRGVQKWKNAQLCWYHMQA